MINPDGGNKFTGKRYLDFLKHGYIQQPMLREAFQILREYYEMAGDELHPMDWHDELIIEFVISEDRLYG